MTGEGVLCWVANGRAFTWLKNVKSPASRTQQARSIKKPYIMRDRRLPAVCLVCSSLAIIGVGVCVSGCDSNGTGVAAPCKRSPQRPQKFSDASSQVARQLRHCMNVTSTDEVFGVTLTNHSSCTWYQAV